MFVIISRKEPMVWVFRPKWIPLGIMGVRCGCVCRVEGGGGRGTGFVVVSVPSITFSFILAFHSLSHGGTEHGQGSILSLLRNVVIDKQTTWKKYIFSLRCALNTCDN